MKKILIPVILFAIAFVISMANSAYALDVQRSLEKEIRKVEREVVTTDIESGPTLRLGDGGRRVLQLSDKLHAKGYNHKRTAVFTEELQSIVMKYQADSGLVVDGLVGRKTIAMLNFDKEEKLVALRFSLEQWNNRTVSDRSIIVNIPAYELAVVENGNEVLRSKTIVGRPKHATPIFTDTVFSIKYNPEWNVPPGIFRRYMNKINNGNEQYLIDHGVEVVRDDNGDVTRMWQPAGPNSALGLMKFEMRNDMNIYLHDTNERYYYNQDYRAKSSGCIRVQEFRKLAAWLRNETEQRIQSRINTNKTHWTAVNETEVHVVYMTAWPNEDGTITYHNDIYGYRK